MLKLILNSEEFKLGDVVSSVDCFKKLFEKQSQSQEIIDFLNDPFFENAETKEIGWIKMDPNDKIITFGSNNSILRKEEIFERVS
jgi:hypothetical protein